MQQIQEKALIYWTNDRLKALSQGKNYLLTPVNGAELLFALGLMKQDASLDRKSMRKFVQINHMLRLLQPSLETMQKRFQHVYLIDAGCGKSYLSFLVGWYFKQELRHPCTIIGIDQRADVINRSRKTAEQLEMTNELQFLQSDILRVIERYRGVNNNHNQINLPQRIHGVFSLHACDTATDEALVLALTAKADFFALAPCCQAELSQIWKEKLSELNASKTSHPLSPMLASPHMRRELGAHFTDGLRLLYGRAKGYQVQSLEFVEAEHTNKNRLLLGERRGNYHEPSQAEFKALKAYLLDPELAFERLSTLPSR